ncbi:MAG: hypothetical protein HY290_04535 [Planctomycetia bacterium]|nr:hypothetical protein [Planctomycetia bacterium]
MKLLQRVFRKSRQEPEPSDIEYVPALSQVAIELIVSSLYRTLHPLITHRFHRHTVNSRTEAGRRRGLQRTQELASADSRFVWVRATLSDPYKHVDQELLLIALWNVFGNKKLYRLLEDCVRDSSRKGLVPTAPLCHLLKEFFIDWYVVRIWRLEHRRVPLIRDSNEILILAKSPAEGEVFKNAFKKLLASSQLPVCSPAGITVHDLGSGEEATWLRRRISRRGGKWIVK